jgi:serine/threonine-protein kinase
VASDELIGKTLGQQYDIQAVLGKGGMSTVYLAHQRTMDRKVAVKVLPREFLHDEAFLQRFQQETRTIARLEHPHILPVYDAGEDQGVPYIVMRYLSGGSVGDLVRDRLPDNATVARIVTEIAGALDHAHARNIIHRDIKPSNILLDQPDMRTWRISALPTRRAKASGLPLAGDRQHHHIARSRSEGPAGTHSVDIYALGIVVFEM